MPTVHIESNKNEIAPRVLMPGDPKRAYYIAYKFLSDVKMVNTIRAELAFTGTYKGVPLTIFSSGMGIGSMGIYSYELFNDYNVESIIRVGTAGSFSEDLNIYDIFLADSSYSVTSFDEESGNNNVEVINSSFELNSALIDVAALKGINLKQGRVFTTEAFYCNDKINDESAAHGCKAVEMEAYALFYNAKRFKKKATAIMTITDNFLTNEKVSAEDREKKLDEMILLSLDAIIKK